MKDNNVPEGYIMPSEEELGLSEMGGSTTSLISLLDRRLYDKNWYAFWGDVDEGTCEVLANFILDAMLYKKPEINIFIMSGGGDSDATRGLLGIMEIAKQSGVIIKAYGAGLIASAAFDIFTACSQGYRFAFEATMFMQHSSSGHVEDQDMYELQKKFDKWTLQKYTNIHAATIKKFLRTGNWWFDPQQALGYGVCDAVVKMGDPLPVGPIFPARKTAEQQKKEALEHDEDDD